MKLLFLNILALFLLGIPCHGQTSTSKADSLISIYETLPSGSEKTAVGQKIIEELYYIDRIKAKQYNLELFPIARVSDDPLIRANAYYFSHLLNKKELNSESFNEFAYLDSSLNILENNYEKIDPTEAKLLMYLNHNSRGINYANKEDPEKALAYYQKALTIAKQLDDPKRIAQVSLNMAYQHYFIDNYDEAISQLRSIADYAKKYNITSIETAALNILGSSYQQLDSFEQAKIYVRKAMNLAREIGNEQQVRETLLTMGLIVESLSQLDSAMFYMERSLEETIGKDDPLIEAQIYSNMARVESKRRNSDKARTYFLLAEKLNKNIDRKDLDAKLLIDISSLEYDNENYQLAYEMILEGYLQQDSITSIENRKLIKELDLKYGKAEDEKLIAEQKLALANKQKRITYLTAGFLFSFLGFLTFYGFYQNSKRKRELVQKELSFKTMEIDAMEKEKSILALSSTLEGQEAERSRIAQDLHDGLGGLLSAVKAHYGKIQKEIKQLESLKVFDVAEGMLDNACEEVRRISHNLMPPLLRSQGLSATLTGLFNSYQSEALTIDFDVRNMETRLEDTQEVFLYRIAQELLTNAIKHSNASKIEVSLYGLGDTVQLIYEDNGKGFSKEDELGGMGLLSIRSRVEYLNGELEIESTLNKGSIISVAIPRTMQND